MTARAALALRRPGTIDAIPPATGAAEIAFADPARRNREADAGPGVDVQRFAIGADGTALVDTRWTLLEDSDERFPGAGRERLTARHAAADSFKGQAAALLGSLVGLGRRIADAIVAAGLQSLREMANTITRRPWSWARSRPRSPWGDAGRGHLSDRLIAARATR